MFNRGFKSKVYLIILAYLFVFSMPHMAIAASTTDAPLNRNVQISVKVTNSGKQTANGIRIKLPLISADSPYQQTVKETFNQKVEQIVAGEAGSRTAHILIDTIAPGKSETIIVDYELNIIPGGGLSSSAVEDLQQYLKPSSQIESDDPEIVNKAIELTASAQGEMAKINNIGNFINAHMTYNLNSPYKNKGAISALHNREGVCEDYAALFIALSRASGIPARQVNGFADPKLTGASWKTRSQEVSLQGFRHAWAEIYIQGRGWVAVDPTFKIYPQEGKDSLVELSPSHIAQNYNDQPVKASYQGEKISVGWGNLLINK